MPDDQKSVELKLELFDRLSLSDDDLIRGVTNTENNFVERKTASDRDGWLKTAVAFANSCPVGLVGILYVGVDDKGKIQNLPTDTNFEKLQKTVSQVLSAAYPPIYHLSKTLTKDGQQFLAVIVAGSVERPHFTGKAWIRVGPETREASEEQFELLVAERSSVIRVLTDLVGKDICIRVAGQVRDATLVGCNQHFITVRYGPTVHRCHPVSKVLINFEPIDNKYLLEIG